MGISVGIVGVGQFGQHFVQLFRDHPDVNRVAICDLNPDRLAACARKFGINETYSSLDEICRSDLDALAFSPSIGFTLNMQFKRWKQENMS